jgi:hypothetical protein
MGTKNGIASERLSSAVKRPLDHALIAIQVLCIGVFVYGFINFPDAPIRPCGVGQFCGKSSALYPEEKYQAFVDWTTALIVSIPFGVASGFLLYWRARRRAARAWERLRIQQTELSPDIEEQRYAKAWKGLRWREIAAWSCLAPLLLWVAWGIVGGWISGHNALVPLALFAAFVCAGFWRDQFPCPRCGNRFFAKRTFGGSPKRCSHCDLERGASFEQSLAELRD